MIQIQDFDARRKIVRLKTKQEAIDFAADHWIHTGERAIQQRGKFAVALSGGSTPKAIYEVILAKHAHSLPWDKVWLFWSDERAVPANHPESNYKMAMDAGIGKLGIPSSQIFRLKGEGNLETNAANYQEIITRELGSHLFDLIMLGVGEDGHTASLFPKTAALQEPQKLVVANRISDTTHRLTLTYPCIEKSRLATFYAFGAAKASIVFTVLNAPIVSPFPASKVGTADKKALWILDQEAGHLLS